ncbi:D-inositol-3-phosphate glycosyltransferase [Candidatus Lokiarchaeum ossiferum]|uniref:D-inositol-3-phosphate glycosyltransferase n=1 Tax=Candidatus Lokiarchaeum ossiferum TaxID=2951803 RepID=A0ABY6HWT5_9ARCH|nr:D-inositol-3-phosphate glycosyltransferase [Candidatus Lokiarchaeum sp. B-35]
MKIAVYHNLPSGGAKRALYNNIKYLKARRNEIDLYIPSTANEDYLPLKNIVDNFFSFPVNPSFRTFLVSLFKYKVPSKILSAVEEVDKNIACLINKKDYDIVICEQDQFFFSPFILKYITKPMLYFCQQPSRENEAIVHHLMKEGKLPKKNHFHRFIDRKLYEIELKNVSNVKNILANSFFSKESILRKYGLNAQVSYLGIDLDVFSPKKIQRQSFLLSVGSCTPAKGFDFLIKSLSFIPKNKRPLLILVSNNVNQKWKEYLLGLAKSKAVEIEIRSNIGHEELLDLYRTTSILLYSPYLEPFGLVPLEALACGTPIIGVREGGIRESLGAFQSGILIERIEKKFGNAIESLLNDQTDDPQSNIDRRNYVEEFWGLKKAGERFLSHIQRIIMDSKTN